MLWSTMDKAGAVPLYHQLYSTLHEQIVTGVFAPGARLPSERELMRRFSVARVTVQRAIAALEHQGYVERQRGSGTYVREGPLGTPIDASMKAVMESVGAIGTATHGQIVELVNLVPPPDVKAAMNLKRGAKVQRSVHVRSRHDERLGLFTTYVPLDIGRRIKAEDIEAQPMLLLLQALGVHAAWASQAIGVELADAETARLLKIERGQPLVRLQRVVYDDDDRPVEFLVALYRGDRYEYKTVLRRDVHALFA